MTSKLPHQYEILFAKADSDIKIARLAMSAIDAHIDDATIMFHLQQAAEKLLKSLLAVHGMHFEKAHDLTLLMTSCRSAGIDLPQYTEDFVTLNPFAVIGTDMISFHPASLILLPGLL
jgi:HEPN domain-containing protein